MELGAQGEWRGFSIDAAYTYLDTEDAGGAQFGGVPQNQASAWLEYAFEGPLAGVEAGFGVRYVGETEDAGVVNSRRDARRRDARLRVEPVPGGPQRPQSRGQDLLGEL